MAEPEHQEEVLEYDNKVGIVSPSKGVLHQDDSSDIIECPQWYSCTILEPKGRENLRAWFKWMGKDCTDALNIIYHTLSEKILREGAKVLPSMQTVLKPFGMIHPSRTRVIMVGIRPYLDGTATGIPIESFKIPKAKKDQQMLGRGRQGYYHETPSFKAFRQAAVEGMDYKDEDRSNCVKYFYECGILLINAEMTAEKGVDDRYNISRSHYYLWAQFMYPFLIKCQECGTAIVLLGKEAQNMGKRVEGYESLYRLSFPTYEDFSATVPPFVETCKLLYDSIAEMAALEAGL